MTFLSPLMMFGAAAVSVPLVLHFFYKARYKPLPWAAMTFLKHSVEQTSRRLKFQEWILLALRCLVLLLLAFALARPAAHSASLTGRGESVDAAFLFDTSYSMGARDGDSTRLERAKAAAESVLDTLPPRSTVQIFSCSDKAVPLGPVSRTNLDQARQIVKSVELGSQSTDFLPGLAEALSAISAGVSPSKEVYLFSDLQKSGFERQLGAVRARCEEIRHRGNLIFVRCANPETELANVAVQDITTPTTIPHVGTRVPFDVLVRNTGKSAVKDITVVLEFRDRPLSKEEMTVKVIEAGQTVPVSVTGKLDVAGPQVVSVRLRKGKDEGDDLPGDNRFDKIVLVRDKVNVLVVDGTPDARNITESGSHYVRNALAPVQDGLAKDYVIQPTVYSAEEVGPAVLTGMDVVYLLNVPSSSEDKPGIPGLSKAFVEALGTFVRNGGGLVVGCGDLVDYKRYNEVFGSGGAGLLPFDLGNETTTASEYPYVPAPESVDGPSFLAPFKDAPYNAALRGVELTKMFRVNELGPSAVGGRVLLRTASLQPLVVSRVVGEGEVVLVTTSLDGRWGNLPSRAEAFIPFTQFALTHLTGRKVPGGNRTAGEVLSWSPPEAGKGFDLIKPDGARVRLGQAVVPEPGQRLTVTATDTAQAGVYAIVPEGESEARGAVFAVNPDLRESQNLDAATAEEMEGWLGFAPAIVQAGFGTETAVGQQRISKEYTEYLLLLLFLLLLAEAAWAWFCGKAR